MNSARANPSAILSDFAEKSNPVAGIKSNYEKLIEITNCNWKNFDATFTAPFKG